MPDPPKNAPPILEAIREWGEGALGVMSVEQLCRKGEWTCWARPGSRDAPYEQVLLKAWERNLPTDGPFTTLSSGELYLGGFDCLCRSELRDVPVPMLHPETGRQVLVTERRPVRFDEWWDPVFAPASSDPLPHSLDWRYAVERWFIEQYAPSLGDCEPSAAR